MSLPDFLYSTQAIDDSAIEQAYAHHQQLTKPEGSLGRLEEVVFRLAGMQKTAQPQISRPWISVFAADHGVAAEGVSAFPQSVTAEMVKNFCAGGAAISVLAKHHQAQFEVVDVGILSDVGPLPNLICARVAAGTANFVQQAAMSEAQLFAALQAGVAAAERAQQAGADLFIAGEMGIGNTTSAAAMTAVLSGESPSELTGEGTGISLRQKRHKTEVIETALALHEQQLTSPLRILQYLGGFEIAAMCGAFLRATQLGIPILVDGMIASTALWIADMLSRNDQLGQNPDAEAVLQLGKYSLPERHFCTCGSLPRVVDWCFFAHQSAEPAHAIILNALGVEPLLQLELRLGEASGAALALPLLQQACILHAQMATFEQAGVPRAD